MAMRLVPFFKKESGDFKSGQRTSLLVQAAYFSIFPRYSLEISEIGRYSSFTLTEYPLCFFHKIPKIAVGLAPLGGFVGIDDIQVLI